MIKKTILVGLLLSATVFSTMANAASLNPGDVQITNKSKNVLSFRLMVSPNSPTASTGFINENDHRVLTNGAIGRQTAIYKVQYLTTASKAVWVDVPYANNIQYSAQYSYRLGCSEASCSMN